MSGVRAYELAQRIGYPTRLVTGLLVELEEDGLVVRVDGRYRISDYAEERFGQAFRDLDLGRSFPLASEEPRTYDQCQETRRPRDAQTPGGAATGRTS